MAPAEASADPAADDTNVSTEPTTDPTVTDDGHPATGDSGTAAKAPDADTTLAGDSPSETEVSVGDGGPEVIIRNSGGYTAGESTPTPQPSAPASTPVESTTAEQQTTPATDTATPEPTAATEVVEGAARAGRVVTLEPIAPTHVHSLGTGFEVVVTDEHAEAPAGAPVGPAPTEPVLAAPAINAAPVAPGDDDGVFTASEGLLSVASALFSGVLNVLFEPSTDGAPADSPIAWAVLGLVRRQFNGTSGESNPVVDPRQTSRTFWGDERTFTLVTTRYAYVLDRDSNAISVVDVDTRTPVDTPVSSDQVVGSPVASPDGSRIFVTSAHNGGVYAVPTVFGESVDIDDVTASADPIVAGTYHGPTDYYVPDGGLAFSADGALLYVTRQHAQIVSGMFLPANGDVVVIGNNPADPATYLQVIGGPVGVVA
jgi:hypothetical protein